jgi:protein TonB
VLLPTGTPRHEPERLVYVEPAPPPPPLLPDGDADRTAEHAHPATEEVPSPVAIAELPKSAPTRAPTRRQNARPTRHPDPPHAVAAKPITGDAARREGGAAEGVSGGTIGGTAGGTVGGHGDAPIAAELAAHPPVVLARVMPQYPVAARAQHIEGRVLLRAVVDRSGRVEESITVARSVPPLDEAAVAALRQWRFTPGRDRSGHAVRVQIEVPMRFQLR